MGSAPDGFGFGVAADGISGFSVIPSGMACVVWISFVPVHEHLYP
jgi:hypothetical protein